MGVDSGSIFPLGSTISLLHAVWEVKQEPQNAREPWTEKGVCEALLLILCPQTEPPAPSIITLAPQNSLLGPKSLSWCLASTPAAVVLALLHWKGLLSGGLVPHTPAP